MPQSAYWELYLISLRLIKYCSHFFVFFMCNGTLARPHFLFLGALREIHTPSFPFIRSAIRFFSCQTNWHARWDMVLLPSLLHCGRLNRLHSSPNLHNMLHDKASARVSAHQDPFHAGGISHGSNSERVMIQFGSMPPMVISELGEKVYATS